MGLVSWDSVAPDQLHVISIKISRRCFKKHTNAHKYVSRNIYYRLLLALVIPKNICKQIHPNFYIVLKWNVILSRSEP